MLLKYKIGCVKIKLYKNLYNIIEIINLLEELEDLKMHNIQVLLFFHDTSQS